MHIVEHKNKKSPRRPSRGCSRSGIPSRRRRRCRSVGRINLPRAANRIAPVDFSRCCCRATRHSAPLNRKSQNLLRLISIENLKILSLQIPHRTPRRIPHHHRHKNHIHPRLNLRLPRRGSAHLPRLSNDPVHSHHREICKQTHRRAKSTNDTSNDRCFANLPGRNRVTVFSHSNLSLHKSSESSLETIIRDDKSRRG
jgi:hypothetical protein